MKPFFGYIRVSTAKQGTHGVSLDEQRSAIEDYARRNDLAIVQWFEERETAAKTGRPIFAEMLKLLRAGKALGAIIHKVDRSSRNFRDWADIGDLVDTGIDIRFATEGLDLQSRGGRIAADVLAVVATDYVRNLREETKKGMRGRLKQGLYPMPAPIGYRDCGGGNCKEIDAVAGPLVQKAFELYATGNHSITTLTAKLSLLGLRTRNGRSMSRNGVAQMLHNPFYMGIIRVRTTGDVYEGAHKSLISKALFDHVQTLLAGKALPKVQSHDFLFRRLLTCRCERTLTGEHQKGNIYYRCHIKGCPTTGVREEVVDRAVRTSLTPLRIDGRELEVADGVLAELRQDWLNGQGRRRRELDDRLRRLSARLARLTDTFVDGELDKSTFNERKHSLLQERADLQDQLASASSLDPAKRVLDFFELANWAYVSYEMGGPTEKREVVRKVTSNRSVDRKTIDIVLREPFDLLANRSKSSNGGPLRYRLRTWERLIGRLWKVAQSGGLAFVREEKNSKLSEGDKGVEVAA